MTDHRPSTPTTTSATSATSPRPDQDAPDRRPRACIVRQVDRLEVPLVRDSEALVEAGYDVDLIVMRIDDENHWSELPEGVEVVTLPVHRRRGGITGYLVDYFVFISMATVVVAARHLRRRYRLVQATSLPDPLVIAGLIPRLFGAAVLLKVAEPTPQLSQSLAQPTWLQRLLGRLQIWSARRADHVYTVTEELADDLASRGVDRSTISVVLNVPAPSMASAGTGATPDLDRFTVISHGSIFERYGHDTIVRAIALVRPSVPGIRLVLTGDGPHRSHVESLIEELGITDVFEHHRWLAFPDLVTLLERSDAGIVAQRANPYSHLVNTNKMFEFLMMGVPAVCTRLRATESLIPESDGVVAYFDSDDEVELAKVLLDLAGSPERRAEMAARGRELTARLGADVQRQNYLAAVRSALEHRHH
jgi:glycosyltransferase involved in cell wall biosynthesis